MGPLTREQRAHYYALRWRNRRCVGCSHLLVLDDNRAYCSACRKRQARWQRRHRRRRADQARSYRARRKARAMEVAA